MLQSHCDARDQDIVLRRRSRSDPDDQARGRDNTIVGAEYGGAQPPDVRDEVLLRMQVKTARGCLLIMGSIFAGAPKAT